MSDLDPKDLDDVDHEIRVNELKCRIEEVTGEPVGGWESEDCPPEIREAFLGSVLAFESAPDTTLEDRLRCAGVELPPLEQMDDAALSAKLDEIFQTLARFCVFFSNTDHLSDRELYTHLVEESFREITKEMPPELGYHEHYDILGGCSEEDIYLRHKYYADEEERQHWAEEWPEDEMPPHEDPPYDRDRFLPQAPGPQEMQSSSDW
jgi:hypothetical protein